MKPCAFCSELATLTGEHLWSDWYGRALDTLATRTPDRFRFVRFRNEGSSREVVHEWTKPDLDHKARVVCESCNSGWMSDVENDHAIPTMKAMTLSPRLEVSLLPGGLRSIAAFTFLKAVVGDGMHPTRAPFFTRGDRQRFRETLRLPVGIQVWLGTLIGKKRRRGHISTQYFTISDGRFEGYEIYVFTYVLGFVALQLTAPRWVSLVRDPRESIPRLFQHEMWAEASPEIWPLSGQHHVVWPPAKIIGDDTLDAFMNRWRRIEDRRVGRFSG